MSEQICERSRGICLQCPRLRAGRQLSLGWQRRSEDRAECAKGHGCRLSAHTADTRCRCPGKQLSERLIRCRCSANKSPPPRHSQPQQPRARALLPPKLRTSPRPPRRWTSPRGCMGAAGAASESPPRGRVEPRQACVEPQRAWAVLKPVLSRCRHEKKLARTLLHSERVWHQLLLPVRVDHLRGRYLVPEMAHHLPVFSILRGRPLLAVHFSLAQLRSLLEEPASTEDWLLRTWGCVSTSSGIL